MAQDPNNPATPVDDSLLTWRVESVAVGKRQAAAMEAMAAAEAGTSTPITEANIYFSILLACLKGKVATNSTDMQLWASDLTKDYLAKYPLPAPVQPALSEVKPI